MQHLHTCLYVTAAILQLAAMIFAIAMAREVDDRRPWIVLFAALFIMFAFRVAALFISTDKLFPTGPFLSVPISLLLFLSLFFIRRIAVAERESRLTAMQRTLERDESENRYRSLIELSPDVFFVNAGGKIAYVNAAAMKFFGAKDEAELIGRSPLDFTAPDSRLAVQARIDSLSAIGDSVPAAAEDWFRLDGSSVPVEAAAAVVPWRGKKGILVILRDVSERKRAEDEKTQLLASERAARSIAEHASRMKDEFLATLSHELRTPLNAILGWSQILRRNNKDGEDLERGLDTIERNARVQTRLIEDLLDMSRIISGKLRLDIQKVSPIKFIESAIETVRPAADARGVRLEQILDPLAGPVSGDPNRLQQIVWNLVSNAIKFTPKGGKVQILLQRVNSHIEITVADTGQGIAPEFLPFVFDRFRQADASTTRRHGGLGLGLAIVKQLVDLHGGTVHVNSLGKDQGTTFSVHFPLTAVHSFTDEGERLHPQASSGSVGSNGEPMSLRGIKVLVVDDEPDALALIRRVLEESDALVIEAESAAAGTEMLRREKPDVLISDIGMPVKDGFEFIRDVRALPPELGGRIPAVALTAFARSEDRTRAIMAGYQLHLSKPVEHQELVVTVMSLAGRTVGQG